jgi:hypothetical protein
MDFLFFFLRNWHLQHSNWCTALHCTALHCTAPHCTALCCLDAYILIVALAATTAATKEADEKNKEKCGAGTSASSDEKGWLGGIKGKVYLPW